jgi:hypothetical protein
MAETCRAEVGNMTTSYLRPIPLPSTQQVDDLAHLIKKVESRGQCLLPSTFGQVEVGGTMFFHIEKFKILSFDIDIDKDRYSKLDL